MNNTDNTPPQAWFANIFIDGIKGLYALSPTGRPAADQLKAATRIWIQTLWGKRKWVQDLDAERLARAWTIIYGETTEWITPVQFLEKLPHRQQQQALPPPKIPPEKQRANIARLRSELEKLRQSKKMPH